MKKIKKYLLLAICLFLCFAAFHGAMSVQEVEADEIIRIGIMKFLNRASGLSNQQAEAITDIFTRMLSNSRVIAIIERDRLDSIGREHKLNMSGLVDTGTAVEIGRIAGCQYMLLGSVTQFTKNVTNQKFAFINETKYDASVTVDMRVVDVTTSEVVLSMAETGTATRTDSQLDLGKDIQHSESNIAGLEGEAVSNAISKLGQRIREIVAGEYSQVLSSGGKDITLNVGASSGARMGGLYKVYAEGAEVYDMSGRVIGRRTENIAVVKIVDVQNEFSIANVVKDGGNSANIYRGDKITPISSGEAKDLAKKKAFPKTRTRSRLTLDGEDVNERLNAIADAQGSVKNENISDAITASNVTASASSNVSVAAAPTGKGIAAPSRAREDKSTDPVKVIPGYGLPSGDANTRRIAHINARKLGNKQAAYDKYVELANSYSGDYLAAFRAGEIAQALGRKDDAKTWFDKALSINPNYEPAQKAKEKLESAQSSRSKSRRKKK